MQRRHALAAVVAATLLAVGTSCSGGDEDRGRQGRSPSSESSTATSSPESPGAGGGGPRRRQEWRLDLDETFPGDTLHPRWNVRDETQSNDNSRNLPANVVVDDGLTLLGRQEITTGDSGTRPYTSGDIETYGTHVLPRYFRAEVRARSGFGQGIWTAPLWFRPMVRQPDGTWTTTDGEIDLVETYGREMPSPLVHATVINEYADRRHPVQRQLPYAALTQPDARAWHTYTIEKVPGRITMWADEREVGTFTRENVRYFDRVFERPDVGWALRVTLQIGGPFAGEPDETTRWGEDTDLEVDWIRTWVLPEPPTGADDAGSS